MKNILFVAATAQELSCARRAYELLLQKERSPRGRVDFLRTGVGAYLTLYSLMKQLSSTEYDLVVNVGIAGTNDEHLELGTLVAVRSECIADFGVEACGNFTSAYSYGLLRDEESAFQKGLLNTSYEGLQIGNLIAPAQCPPVPAMTVQSVTDDVRVNARRKKTFGAVVESMEGAAVCYVCREQNIQVLEFRAISNRIGDRNVKNWEFRKCFLNLEKISSEILEFFTF